MSGEVLKHTKASQWTDEGTYKKPKDDDNVRVPRLEVVDASTYVAKDAEGNLILVDAVTGTKTLAQLGEGGSPFDEILLTPKASSTGAEGTIFYDSDDDHLYVATE